MNDVEQRKKVIRDVCRTINMHYFAQDSIVYKKGDSAEDIYLVLSGMVSLCMPTFKEEVN